MEEARNLKSIGPYTLFDVIGEGSFSIVRKAFLNSRSNDIFACKIIPKIKLRERNLAKRFQLEIRVMQALHHPNIVQIYDIFKDKQFYYIIMEYVNGGTLFDYIIDNRRISEDKAKFFIYQIFNTMKFIHSLGICHRDLKLENILINEDYTNIKINDFGLSMFLNKDGLTKSPVGSPLYASPECLSGQPYDPIKSDVWSCGVIMYVLLSSKMPWNGKTHSHIFSQIKKADYEMPSYLSTECKKLIHSILTNDVKKRLTDTEVLNSKWFSTEKETLESIHSLSNPKLLSLKKLDSFFQKDIKSRINSASFESLLSAIHDNENNLIPNASQKLDDNNKLKKINSYHKSKEYKQEARKLNLTLQKVPSITSLDIDFEKKLRSILFEKIESPNNENNQSQSNLSHQSKSKTKLRHRTSSMRHKGRNSEDISDIRIDCSKSITVDDLNITNDSNCYLEDEPNRFLQHRNRCHSHNFLTIPNISSNNCSTSDNFIDDSSREASQRSTEKLIPSKDDGSNSFSDDKISIKNEIQNKKESHKKKKKNKDKKDKKELNKKNKKKDKTKKKERNTKGILS